MNDLLDAVREAIDWAVDAGLTKRQIITVLEGAIEDVKDNEEIPE